MKYHSGFGAAVLAAAGVAAPAHADVLPDPGTSTVLYQLENHPDGSATPPSYGLRLDELYDVTSGHDIFTFDFEDAQSNMLMAFSSDTIRIYGTVYGGRDTGSGYANDGDLGLYTVDFTYSIGVQLDANDDDTIVLADMQNTGSIITPRGDVIDLIDKSDGNYSFRLGDEDNDNGHRGFDGISGWGWLNHGGGPHVTASDWVFTVNPDPVPAPGAIALAALGLGFAGKRRR